MLAIRLLPWLERQDGYVHQRLTDVLHGDRTSSEIVAALASARLSTGAASLFSSLDVDALIRLATTASSQDVRIAAVRALAVMPAESRVVSALLERCRTTDQREYWESLQAVAACAPADDLVLEFFRETLARSLEKPLRSEFGNAARQIEVRRIMRLAGELRVEAGESIAERLRLLADNYKTPERMRVQAIRTFARVAPSTDKTLTQVVAWIGKHSSPYESTAPSIVGDVLTRARQKVGSVRAIYPTLSRLEDALIQEWNRVRPERSRFIDDPAFRGLRYALRELREIRASFREFETAV